MNTYKGKAAPSAGTPESGKEIKSNLSVSLSRKKVNPSGMYGYFSMDEDGNAYFEGIPVGEIIGNKLQHSGYAHLEIEVWWDEDA